MDNITITNIIDTVEVITTNEELTIVNNIIDSTPIVIKELARGEQGIQGVAGKTAYQLALENGFIGTEHEWLNSLKAAPNIIRILSNSNIGGGRVVVIDNGILVYADNTNINHVNKILGITMNASSNSEYSNILTLGELNGFLNLLVGEPIYLSTNGTLTQTLPSVGFILQLGVAISNDSISFNCKLPIVLN